MRILVVSDIHANWAALEAIREPFDVCLCLGDLVDYGPDPSQCVRWAMNHATYAVRGNHDHGAAQGIEVVGEAGFRYLTRVTRDSVWQSLDAEERRYLLQLPVTQRATIDGVKFLLVHATPRDPLDEYVLKDRITWERRLQNIDADIVCVGHSHMQFHLKANDSIVLNPGSVGLPRDGDPRAAYAVIENRRIELKRAEYPSERTVRRVREQPWPERAKAMLGHVYRAGRLPPDDRPSLASAASRDDGEPEPIPEDD